MHIDVQTKFNVGDIAYYTEYIIDKGYVVKARVMDVTYFHRVRYGLGDPETLEFCWVDPNEFNERKDMEPIKKHSQDLYYSERQANEALSKSKL